MDDEIPRPLTDAELRLLRAEVKGRTVHLGQRVHGEQAWKVVNFILDSVIRAAGPDLDYAVQYTEQAAEEYYCGDQVVTTTLRGICLMYAVPFVLPRPLWDRELARVRFSSWYSTRRMRQIQDKFPWAVSQLRLRPDGTPVDLAALRVPLRIGRRMSSMGDMQPGEVQQLITYHDASYWRFRFWQEELIAMRPEEYREMRAKKWSKGGKGRNARYSDIHEKDKIQVTPDRAALLPRTTNR